MIKFLLSAASTTAVIVLFSNVAALAQSASSKPGTVFRDCADCPEMVVIPAGSFTMGSPESDPLRDERDMDERPQHTVTISRPFAVSKFEVTRGQFGQFIRESGYKPADSCWVWTGTQAEPIKGKNWQDPNFPQNDNHPVACITWPDAKEYVAWLAGKTGKAYRLISEAEWEYAARAGATTKYSFGDNDDDLCKHGNVGDLMAKESGGPGAAPWVVANCRDGFGNGTAPVGSFPANRFGLHDVHGNVWEWTEDCHHESYSGAPSDGSAWTSGECKERVHRGGGWNSEPRNFRLANRIKYTPDILGGSGPGLRIARAL